MQNTPPAYFSDPQKKRYVELCEEWEQTRELKAGDHQLLGMMACVDTDLAKLQRFINQHGPTYQVRTKSGDSMSRARPEYQQLQEARQRLGTLIDKMSTRGENTEADPDGFIAL